MKKHRYVIAAALVSALLLGACGKSGSDASPPVTDTTPPEVIATAPAANSVDAALGAAITATFSEPMKAASLTTASFIVTGPAGAVGGTVTTAGSAATFTPLSGLAGGATYTAAITTEAQDLSGNSLEAAYSWQFTTQSGAQDTTPPAVVSVTPADTSTGVAAGTVITAVFSETINCGTVTASSFTLTYEGTASGSVQCTGATATFTPDAPLYYYNLYTATISDGVTDSAGNALASPYSWSFRIGGPPDTTAPTISSRNPANNATGVNISSAITVTFSEPMLASTITTSTFRVNDGTSDIAGSVTSSGATAVFTPVAALTGNRTYTVTITTGARDIAGNPPAADQVWSFTTAATLGGVTILYARNGSLYRVNEDGTARTTIAAGSLSSGASYAGVSPYGKLIYLKGSGDLWTVNTDGTGAVQLVTGTATVGFKGITSTGRVAYTMNNILYSVNTDGSGLVTLSNAFDDVKIAAAGRVVYRGTVGGVDRTINSVMDDGTNALILDGTTGMKNINHVSAAGQVFYTRELPYYSIGSQGDLYQINADGTSFSPIATSDLYSEGYYGQAPDGTIAITSCPLPACDTSLLSFGTFSIDLIDGGMRGVTQDNRFIVESGPLGQQDLKSITTGGVVAVLAADPSLNDIFLAVHPDNRVIYRKMTGGTQSDIFSVKSDGSGTAILANSPDGESFLGITPTGRVVYQAGNTTSIYSINSDGTDQRLLHTSPYPMTFLGFSSSGKVLYLDHDPTLGADLFIADHDGSAPVNVTNNRSTGITTFFSSLP